MRDLLRSAPPKDFDVVSDATLREVRRVFGRRGMIVGKRFPICIVQSGDQLVEVRTRGHGFGHWDMDSDTDMDT